MNQSLPNIEKSIKIDSRHKRVVVAIGTSTGGPRALQRVLCDLPKQLAAPILIVQHMPAGFTKSLADRLNSIASIRVKEAAHGEIIKDGTVYIAPGNFHMKIQKNGTAIAIELTKEHETNGHRPSVDILFESVSKLEKLNKIAVVLTGMGNDGAEGIKILKRQDPCANVIAESEETAIVYGMPKSAVKTNLVNYVKPLNQVGETITSLVNSSGGM